LVCVDSVNLLGENINTISKNTAAILDASQKIVLEGNTERSTFLKLFTRMQHKP